MTPGLSRGLALPPQRVLALRPGEDHGIGIVGRRAEPLADLLLALDHDRVALEPPGRRRELRREPAVGRQRDSSPLHRVERLAEFPPQRRAPVEEGELAVARAFALPARTPPARPASPAPPGGRVPSRPSRRSGRSPPPRRRGCSRSPGRPPGPLLVSMPRRRLSGANQVPCSAASTVSSPPPCATSTPSVVIAMPRPPSGVQRACAARSSRPGSPGSPHPRGRRGNRPQQLGAQRLRHVHQALEIAAVAQVATCGRSLLKITRWHGDLLTPRFPP